MAQIGSNGNGKASSLSVNNFGPTTVAGNVRTGSQAAKANGMKTGAGGGAMKGVRSTFLGAANSSAIGSDPGYGQVSAGTPGGPTGSGGKGGTTMASSGLLPGLVTKKAVLLSPSGKPMKTGKGAGATKGVHKSFI